MPSMAASAVMPPPMMRYLECTVIASSLFEQPRAPPVRVHFAFGLADGTVVGFAVLVVDHRDRGPAPRAGFAALAVHREVRDRLFHGQGAGGGGPVGLDPALERGDHRAVEPRHIVAAEPPREAGVERAGHRLWR